MKTGTKTNGAVVDIDTNNTHGTVVISIGGDNNVNVLDNSLESLVQFLLVQLQLKQSTVHLVHE